MCLIAGVTITTFRGEAACDPVLARRCPYFAPLYDSEGPSVRQMQPLGIRSQTHGDLVGEYSVIPIFAPLPPLTPTLTHFSSMSCRTGINPSNGFHSSQNCSFQWQFAVFFATPECRVEGPLGQWHAPAGMSHSPLRLAAVIMFKFRFEPIVQTDSSP